MAQRGKKLNFNGSPLLQYLIRGYTKESNISSKQCFSVLLKVVKIRYIQIMTYRVMF
jgi:hypothetical protein